MRLRASASTEQISWGNIIWIGAVHVLALILGWMYFSWSAFFLFLALHYLVGLFGITFGFHRLLSHKSFKSNSFIRDFAALCGTLACQGGPISWIGQHRVHHAYSDTSGDPHNINRGFWYSHVGFIFNRRGDFATSDEVAHYCPDIASRPYFMFLEKNMILVQFIFGFILLGLGGVIGGSFHSFNWTMGLSFIAWGIFVRLVSGYHVTWLVNSATHLWGSRPNPTTDRSCNNWWVGILAFGEGWHNNHHAQPRSARHGWLWWQFDQTWIVIKTLQLFKLVYELQLPKLPQNQQPDKERGGAIVPSSLGLQLEHPPKN